VPVGVVRIMALAAWGLVAAPACDGCDERPGEASASASSKAQSVQAKDETAQPPGPAPELAITAERADPDAAGAWVPVVQNRGSEPVQLSRDLTVQREADGAWNDTATLALRWSCEQAAEEDCATLHPGGELRPPAWLGRAGKAQCACADCEPAPAGRYRFVVRSCDDAHAVPGPPFAHGSP
jgi:hypothetical protein